MEAECFVAGCVQFRLAGLHNARDANSQRSSRSSTRKLTGRCRQRRRLQVHKRPQPHLW